MLSKTIVATTAPQGVPGDITRTGIEFAGCKE